MSSVGNITGLDKKPSDYHTLDSTSYSYHCSADASISKESVCCRHLVAHENCLLKNGGYCVSVDTTELPDESCHHCKVPTVFVFGLDDVVVKVTVVDTALISTSNKQLVASGLFFRGEFREADTC